MLYKTYHISLLLALFFSLSKAVKQDKSFEETVNGFKFKIDIPDEEEQPDSE
jgi:hypothetical protein